uniref:Uncharacterized protein n=1 Tax=Glossina austeni TaxID=7395 RepID=A0A1A9VV06_GLOAU
MFYIYTHRGPYSTFYENLFDVVKITNNIYRDTTTEIHMYCDDDDDDDMYCDEFFIAAALFICLLNISPTKAICIGYDHFGKYPSALTERHREDGALEMSYNYAIFKKGLRTV